MSPSDESAGAVSLTSLTRITPFRRVKKLVGETGATWEGRSRDELEHKDLGIVCRTCHKRTRWRDMVIDYEVSAGIVTRLWFCGPCGAMLREDVVLKLNPCKDPGDSHIIEVEASERS